MSGLAIYSFTRQLAGLRASSPGASWRSPYRGLMSIYSRLAERYSAMQVFALGAVVFMILATISWIGTCLWRLRDPHVSHSSHESHIRITITYEILPLRCSGPVQGTDRRSCFRAHRARRGRMNFRRALVAVVPHESAYTSCEKYDCSHLSSRQKSCALVATMPPMPRNSATKCRRNR